MAKKTYDVEVIVKEISTKKTLIKGMTGNRTKACGAAEYIVANESEVCEFTTPVKVNEVIHSRVVAENPSE